MAKKDMFRFQPYAPQIWNGRYRRVEGDFSVFHVLKRRSYVIRAFIKTSEGVVSCEAISSPEVRKLVQAINDAKRLQTGVAGGSFLINEFGQVLVPTNRGPRFCVGQISGSLLFRNLDTDDIIDLADDQCLLMGDPWELPYVGVVYNLNAWSEIYFYDQRTDTSEKPVIQDRSLIGNLRNLRRSGAVRFLVNPYGIVLTKVPYGDFDFDEDKHMPVYAGRINYEKWFAKEEIEDVS